MVRSSFPTGEGIKLRMIKVIKKEVKWTELQGCRNKEG